MQLSLGARPCGGWACAVGLEATLRGVCVCPHVQVWVTCISRIVWGRGKGVMLSVTMHFYTSPSHVTFPMFAKARFHPDVFPEICHSGIVLAERVQPDGTGGDHLQVVCQEGELRAGRGRAGKEAQVTPCPLCLPLGQPRGPRAALGPGQGLCGQRMRRGA